MSLLELIRDFPSAELFEPGELLFARGESGHLLFVVLEGEVELEREDGSIEIVTGGGIVGEAAMLDRPVRTQTARARTAVRVAPIGSARYDRLLRDRPELELELRRSVRARAGRAAGALALVFALSVSLAAPAGAQFWEVRNRMLTSPYGAQAGARFGSTVAVGDFDGDGFDDLAVAEWSFDSNLGADTGEVTLWRGSATGLAATKWTTLLGDQQGASFGSALAAGDFDGDGRDELAVGAIGKDVFDGVATRSNAGAVHVYGFDGGLWLQSSPWTQESPGIADQAEVNDYFGDALASGDFDHDGFADLAISAPGEDLSAPDAGAVHVLYGSAAGLSSVGSQIWHLDVAAFGETASDGDQFGEALAVGDFDGDHYQDLAIGAPLRPVDGVDFVGEVYVLFGTAARLGTAGLVAIDPTDVGGSTATDFQFGDALAAGDFNASFGCGFAGSCASDLAIGSPHSTVNRLGADQESAGAVYVVNGSYSQGTLLTGSAIRWTQGSLENGTPSETHDYFGAALAAGSIDHRIGAELVIGAFGEAVLGPTATGVANLLMSAGGAGLQAAGDQLLWGKGGFATAPAVAGDEFGAALALGDFDHDGFADLAVGNPFHTLAGQPGAGVVQILYGALFADGFESGGSSRWN